MDYDRRAKPVATANTIRCATDLRLLRRAASKAQCVALFCIGLVFWISERDPSIVIVFQPWAPITKVRHNRIRRFLWVIKTKTMPQLMR